MEEKKAKGLSMKEWILCIGAILVLTLFMVLPPTFRIVFLEEETKKEPIPTITPGKEELVEPIEEFDDSTYEKEICTKNLNSLGPYTESLQVTFSHKEKELKMYTEKHTRVYDFLQESQKQIFESDQKKCDSPPAIYFHIKGYQYNCETEEGTIQITEKYNLETFSNTTVEEDGELKVVSVAYFYNQNVDIIKAGLESQGYTCIHKPESN